MKCKARYIASLLSLAACSSVISLPAWSTDDENSEASASERVLMEGRHTFRFDTFGDEAFWGDTLRLHEAIEGSALGGVGPGVSPRTALVVGLKVDVAALPETLVEDLRAGRVDLDNPATTVALLKLNAVVGVTGFFNGTTLRSIGIQCALCHSTVDNSLAAGIGHRLDGWANRDLNVGAIVALAPDLSTVATLLQTDQKTVRRVLGAWGPGNSTRSCYSTARDFAPTARRPRRSFRRLSGSRV